MAEPGGGGAAKDPGNGGLNVAGKQRPSADGSGLRVRFVLRETLLVPGAASSCQPSFPGEINACSSVSGELPGGRQTFRGNLRGTCARAGFHRSLDSSGATRQLVS